MSRDGTFDRPLSPELSPSLQNEPIDPGGRYPLPPTPPLRRERDSMLSPVSRYSGLSMSKRTPADDGIPAIGNAMGLKLDDDLGVRTTSTRSRPTSTSTTYVYSSSYEPGSPQTSAEHSRSTSTTTSSTTLYTTSNSTLSFAFSETSTVGGDSRSGKAMIANASDSDGEGDETERGPVFQVRAKHPRRPPALAIAAAPDSEIDGEIELCEVIDPPSPSSAHANSTHKRKLQSFPMPERHQRPRRHTHIPSASMYPTYATPDADYVPELDESLPYALRRVLPWIRIVILGWVLVLTLVVISICVAFGMARAAWVGWVAWRAQRRQRARPACTDQHPYSTILLTLVLALIYTICNIAYKLWKLWRDWQSTSRQRCVTRSPGRGGQRP